MFRGGGNASKSKSVLVGKLAVFRGVANASKLESVPVGDWRDKSVVERDSELEAELRCGEPEVESCGCDRACW